MLASTSSDSRSQRRSEPDGEYWLSSFLRIFGEVLDLMVGKKALRYWGSTDRGIL